jgi:hypothetical protein
MSVTWQLSEWRNDQWSDALESLCREDQSLWKLTKRLMRVPTPLQVPAGLALSRFEMVEALADGLEAQFQPVDDPSDPAFTERFDVAMCAYEYAAASERTLTTHSEVFKAIRRLKVGKAPGPNVIPNRVLRYLRKQAILFPMKVINVVLRR